MMATANRLVVVLLVAASVAAGCGTTRNTGRSAPESRSVPDAGSPERYTSGDRYVTTIDGHRVTLEVAADDVSRMRGLSGRDGLSEDHGMIFLYPDARMRSFWMKGTRIGLDVAFLDDDGRIFDLHSLDPPTPGTTDANMPRARSTAPARFVVEMAHGWFAARDLGVGAGVVLTDALRGAAGDER